MENLDRWARRLLVLLPLALGLWVILQVGVCNYLRPTTFVPPTPTPEVYFREWVSPLVETSQP